jgi:hypothetical protein
MKSHTPDAMHSDTRIARFAIAQFLLFEATVESLAALGPAMSRLRHHQPADTGQLTEPFRARYRVFRRMLEEDRKH